MAAKSGLHQDMLLPHHTFLCPPHPSSPPPIHACCCKSFFLFFSSFIPCHLNLSAATLLLLLPPPPLALTQAIPHHCHIIPWGHSNHLLHPSSHRSQAHKSHPATLTLTMPGAPTKKTSDKSFPFFPSSLMVQDTSPSYACRPPLHYHHNHHHFIASTTGATSLTPLLLQLV